MAEAPVQRPEFEAIILAGGTGSRLHPLTDSCPKVLLPVCNRPILEFQLTFLERWGFKSA